MTQSKEKIRKKVLEFTYTVIFEPAEEGGYVVHVPSLNNAVTQGDTLEEAHQWAKDLILSILSASIDHGRPIPREQGEIEGEKMTVQLAVL